MDEIHAVSGLIIKTGYREMEQAVTQEVNK